MRPKLKLVSSRDERIRNIMTRLSRLSTKERVKYINSLPEDVREAFLDAQEIPQGILSTGLMEAVRRSRS